MTIYVPTDYPDGHGALWWLALEQAIGAVDTVSIKMDGELRTFKSKNIADKEATFYEIYWWLRSIAESDARAIVSELCRDVGVDDGALCRDLVMTWDQIRRWPQIRSLRLAPTRVRTLRWLSCHRPKRAPKWQQALSA